MKVAKDKKKDLFSKNMSRVSTTVQKNCFNMRCNPQKSAEKKIYHLTIGKYHPRK
jgi:hypothetical protein